MKIDNTINWYENEAILSVEILKSYIKSIEDQIETSVGNFAKNKKIITLEEYPNEYYARIITLYNGLDDETFDLEKVFKEYLPNLQRYSVLMTMFNFLENELDALCFKIRKKDNLTLNLTDINGKGLNRSLRYLDKVAGIKVNNKLACEIINIQRIRNLIVHNGGKLIDKSDKPRTEEIKFVKESPFLDGKDEIIINAGFLTFVIEAFEALLSEIDKGIKTKYKIN